MAYMEWQRACKGCAELKQLKFSYSRVNTEAAVQRCSVEKLFSEILRNLQENTCATVSFNRISGLGPATLFKKRQVFSCEFNEIPKNTFFYRIPPVAASVN